MPIRYFCRVLRWELSQMYRENNKFCKKVALRYKARAADPFEPVSATK